MPARLRLTRQQILAFRRRVSGLEARVPKSPKTLRRAAWAGLQDSMPRSALLSLHARIDGVEPSTWADPSLAQLWGPRYSTYVVPKRDFALFSLGRYPESGKGRLRAEQMAERLRAYLGNRRATDREIARAIGIGNAMRYGATTGTIAIRWEGARAPVVWIVPRPDIDPADACRELARRHLNVFGPTTARQFARWAGISQSSAKAAFASLEASLVPVRSPLGDEWLLAEDETAVRAGETAPRQGCSRAGIRTSCSTGRSASSSSHVLIGGSSSGRRASGRGRSSSTARSAEPGDDRSTPFGSTPGSGCRARGATRSRRRPAPCHCPASTGPSRCSGTDEQSYEASASRSRMTRAVPPAASTAAGRCRAL